MMPNIKDDLLAWLEEPGASGDSLDIFAAVDRIAIRLRERGVKEEEITEIVRVLAPLDFLPSPPHEDVWKSYFTPRRKQAEGVSEYPRLAELNANHVDQWIEVSALAKRLIIRARFADAVWELGKRLGSQRKDLYQFARMAAEMYLEATKTEVRPQDPWAWFQIVNRSIRLGLQLRLPDLVERGFKRMMDYADAAPLEHIGLWTQPFDQLLELSGLNEVMLTEILERYEVRVRATVERRDLFRIMMTGQPLVKHFYDRRLYERAREITLLYGEAVLAICLVSDDPAIAVAHIGEILDAYRRVGLREEAERVRLSLEARGREAAAAMKSRRVEVKFNRNEIEKALSQILNTPEPFVALYRLSRWCAPSVEQIRQRLDSGVFSATQIIPTVIVGANGLAVRNIGTYDNDKEGQVILAMTQEMNLSCGILIGGLEEWKTKFELGGVRDAPGLLDSLLVPIGRVDLFRQGLEAFESGDYVKCIHVLIPQVENSLREILSVLGISTTKTDEDGGYELKNINDVLHDAIVQASIEEDLWYFLKALYSDKRGMNIRNLVAHGIAPAASFNRGVASLVVQSIVFLAAVRPEATFLGTEKSGEPEPSEI
jgi:hypothetical protein